MENPVTYLAQWLNERPAYHLSNVWRIVSTLQAHWREQAVLSPDNVKSLVGELTYYTLQMPIPIPLDQNRLFARAVRLEPGIDIGYPNVSRLSYIPIDGHIVPSLGRMNRTGQSMFYACLGSDPNSMGAILSEARACAGEVFNILFSEAVPAKEKLHPYDDDLHVTPIGMFDYIRRGVPHPFRLHDEYLRTYNALREAVCVEGMLAMQLADAFITDALKHKESGQLYSVTSEIAAECLTPEVVDGVIYPSTQFDGYPDVALKPSSVDRKLRHHSVMSVRVLEKYDFGIFKTQTIGHGVIHDNLIQWQALD